MDFIEGLPNSHDYTVIWVIIDRLTKFAHFIPLRHPYSAESLATLFMDNIHKMHGMPESIVNDRDVIFQSAFWKEVFKLHGTKLNMSTAHHPQSDGQTEKAKQMLRDIPSLYDTS